MALQDTETVDIVKPAQAAAKYFVNNTESLAFEFGAASDIGLRRSENQDHYLVLRRTRTQQLLLTNMPTEELKLPADEAYAIAVADGMGGAASGELASRIALRAGWDLAGRATSWIMKLGKLDSHELSERIEGFIYMLQQAFIDECNSNPELGRGGTTFTTAYFVNAFASIAQIGDSPCFLWRNGALRRVSVDHTVEQEFITAGVSPEIAGKFSHMLTRCLGCDSNNARPDIHFLRLAPGDQILVCTDGLTDMVDDARIAQCIDEASTAQAACNTLIKLALDAGGKDNVTAVLARATAR